MKEYQNNSAISYLDGMITNNPQQAIQLIDGKQFDNLVEDRSKLAAMKVVAQKRNKDMSEWKREQQTAQAISLRLPLFQKIMTGDYSFEDIATAIQTADLDEEEAQALFKKAGYDVNDLKLLGINKRTKNKDENKELILNQNPSLKNLSLSRKLTDAEKEEVKSEINNLLMSIYSDEGGADLNKMKALSKTIITANEKKILNNSETEEMLLRLQPRLNSVMATKTKQEFTDDGGWGISFGEKDMRKDLDLILRNAGLPPSRNVDKLNSFIPKLSKDDKLLFYKTQNRYKNARNTIIQREYLLKKIDKMKEQYDSDFQRKEMEQRYLIILNENRAIKKEIGELADAQANWYKEQEDNRYTTQQATAATQKAIDIAKEYQSENQRLEAKNQQVKKELGREEYVKRVEAKIAKFNETYREMYPDLNEFEADEATKEVYRKELDDIDKIQNMINERAKKIEL
jgi:hypothetical protein